MRNDLPSMNAGKAMAQAAHAANQFVHQWKGKLRSVWEWQKESMRGFGTTIVLAVDHDTLVNTVELAHIKCVPNGEVCDDTYPFITNKEIAALIPQNKQTAPAIFKEDGRVVMFRNELTCGYVFVADGSIEQIEIVGALPLHP